MEVHQLRIENDMLNMTTDKLLSKTSETERSREQTSDKFAKSLKPEYIGIVVSLG